MEVGALGTVAIVVVQMLTAVSVRGRGAVLLKAQTVDRGEVGEDEWLKLFAVG